METTHTPARDLGRTDTLALSFRRARLALPVLVAVVGVWLARDVAATMVGTKAASSPEDTQSQNDARHLFAMPADIQEPLPTRSKPSVTPPSRHGAKKRSVMPEDETPFVVQEMAARPVMLIQEWLNPEREWPTNRIQIGDIAYPREALVSQILKGTGSDAALALAQQVALARLRASEEQLVLGMPVKPSLATALAEADHQLRLHPPGSAVQGEDRATLLRLENQLAGINRGIGSRESRE